MNITVKLDTKKVERLETFLNSSLYMDKDIDGISKSSYWDVESKLMKINIDRNGLIHYEGRSGFYVPPSNNAIRRFINKGKKIADNPARILKAISARLQYQFRIPRLLSYGKAFDAVMNHDHISEPVLSPYRVNHLSLKNIPGVFSDLRSVVSHYEKWSNFSINDNIIFHYYFSNLLRGYVESNDIKTILEIGAGNGNFPSIIWNDWSPKQIIIIDLPETIVSAYIFLSSLLPNANILLPNDIKPDSHYTMDGGGFSDKVDFVLLTTKQLNDVLSDSVDLVININSFQEMKHEQIDVYFEFIQRVARDSGYFFTVNRIEKIPCDDNPFHIEQTEPPTRFFEYPWNKNNEILINEVSRLHRLVQFHDIGIRLERISKL